MKETQRQIYSGVWWTLQCPPSSWLLQGQALELGSLDFLATPSSGQRSLWPLAFGQLAEGLPLISGWLLILDFFQTPHQ